MLFFCVSYCYSDLMRLWIEEFPSDKIFLINLWSLWLWNPTLDPSWALRLLQSAVYLEESVQNNFFWYKGRKEADVSSEQK